MRITNKIVEKKAKELGFELVGFSPVTLLENEAKQLEDWIGKGYNASMKYMERNFEKRKDVKKILHDATSIISLGMNYFVDNEFPNNISVGKVSRYAWGTDYHFVMWEKLDRLTDYLKNIDDRFKCYTNVDTGPVMDKAWAVNSGLGWQGKNSNVINPNIGSWFFIATIITNYEFNKSEILTDHCGSCTACIDACPTDAIVDPYVVDANKCISFQTIENKGNIDKSLIGKFNNWIFGCDICQEVCPWNKKNSKQTKVEEFKKVENRVIDLTSVNELTNSKFKKKYFLSPIYRAKARGLKRNAEFLLKGKLKYSEIKRA